MQVHIARHILIVPVSDIVTLSETIKSCHKIRFDTQCCSNNTLNSQNRVQCHHVQANKCNVYYGYTNFSFIHNNTLLLHINVK